MVRPEEARRTGGMPTAPDRPWSCLGSSLWLRPLDDRDIPRLRAFLRRSDVLRAGNTAARLRPGDPKRLTLSAAPGVALVATDPLGAPAGVFHLREDRSGRSVVISFAVPRGEPEGLRECLRLLAVLLPARTRALRMTVSGLAAEKEAGRALSAAGWKREGSGEWSRDLPARISSEEAPASHAG